MGRAMIQQLPRPQFAKVVPLLEGLPHTCAAGPSRLLTRSGERVKYCFQAACASALAGDRAAALSYLDQGIGASSYRQGGF